MTKDEYVKTLEKRIADEESDIMHDDYCDGYVDGLKKAIVLSKQLDEPNAQKTSDIEIKNNLSYAGYADLAYNERVINGIESVLIQLGYEVEDD
jgi:superoxide dismutase